jgi:hypothetical protein
MRVMVLICGTQEHGDEVRPAVNLIERTNGDDDKVSSWRHISSHVTEASPIKLDRTYSFLGTVKLT